MQTQNIYAPVEDLREFLWNESDKPVLIGYLSDFRLCDELVETKKLFWNTHLDRITFANCMFMSIRRQAIRGRRVYLYDHARLRDEWLRKRLLVSVRSLLDPLTVDILRQYVWNIGRSAGGTLPRWDPGRAGLLELARQWLVHLSTADLEALAALLTQPASTKAVAAVAA